jgi:hypothetical protein
MRTAALTRAPPKASPASSRTTPRPSGLSTARSQDTSAERKLAAPSPILPLLPLQRKLTIGAANDPLESEADAMADRVMRGQDAAAATPSSAQTVRRKCSCEDSGKPCPKCEEEKKQSVQRKPVSPASHAVTHAEAPPIVHDVLRSPGQPLDRGTRSFMESRFGYDLSHVRIHADSPIPSATISSLPPDNTTANTRWRRPAHAACSRMNSRTFCSRGRARLPLNCNAKALPMRIPISRQRFANPLPTRPSSF